MSAEVATRGCPSNRDHEKPRAQRNKGPRTPKRPGGAATSEVPGAQQGTSVLQGKVKALRAKHKALKSSECCREDPAEDALVTPQLRTYLTEEALQQADFLHTDEEHWRSEEDWSAALSACNGRVAGDLSGCPASHQAANKSDAWVHPEDNVHGAALEIPSTPQPGRDVSFESSSLSLAERVEKNRQELSWKLNKTLCDSEETPRDDTLKYGQVATSKEGSWLDSRDGDGDSGVSLPDSECCREPSGRHQEAKQLLQRARMKARGASPLRASHCVLQRPHSQPTLRRGVAGALTDGGSLSDSSSSDYCSCHRGSRGTSPSHVRFQDESEREAEERYRERKQQTPQTACVNCTPPLKRHSDGHVSWTQHLLQSRSGLCGTCGSYVNGSGASPEAASYGTVRHVHLGSRIPQDGPLSSPVGLKPSPHWILPSQPWRVHTELIRETHIGGDSTADSSGEEEGNRSHRKSCRVWVTRRNSRNNLPNPESEAKTCSSDPDLEVKTRVDPLSLEVDETILDHKVKTKPPTPRTDPKAKSPDSNLEIQNVTGNCRGNTAQKPGVRATSHEKVPGNHLDPNSVPGNKAKKSNPETGIRNLGISLENGAETSSDRKSRIPSTVPCMEVPALNIVPKPNGLAISGRVPVPPAGRAPTSMSSRTARLTARPDGIGHSRTVANAQGSDTERIVLEDKVIQNDPVQRKSRETPAHSATQQPPSSFRCREQREKSHKSRKELNSEHHNEVTEHRNQETVRVSKEQHQRERSHSNRRQRDHERPHTTKAHLGSDPTCSAKDYPKKDQLDSYPHKTPKDNNRSERSSISLQHQPSEGATSGADICASQGNLTQDPSLAPTQPPGSVPCVAPLSPRQPAAKKGDIRSGVKKLFSSLGLTAHPRLGRYRSASMEQISTSAARDGEASGDRGSYDGAATPGPIKKSPSLQSLKRMSPFHLPRKSSSVQNLLGKSERSSVSGSGGVSTAPRRALSVEDIGAPGMARAVGRVAEVYPDGTRLLELQRPPQGSFGFSISSVNGRQDSGVYVQEMTDASIAKLYSGLLRVGDEVLEVNGTKVSFLGPAQLTGILDQEATLSLRVLHQRRSQC